MGSAKKYRDNYPTEKVSAKKRESDPEQNRRDKAQIEQYVNKIHDLLKNDPSAQKKAAAILEALINKPKN